MEMTRSEQTEEESEAFIAPSPFDSSAEREFFTSAHLAVPTAIPVSVDDTFQENVQVAIAAPITEAVLESTTAAGSKASKHDDQDDSKSVDEDVIVKPEPYGYGSHVPAAHSVPSADSLVQQQHTASSQMRAANFRGVLSSEEEMAGIARARRDVPQIQRDTDEAIKAANIAAIGKKGKKDEGLAVDHMVHHLNTKCSLDEQAKKEDDDTKLYGTTNAEGKRGGYEVKEYDVSEYTTADYEISEYKSVYE